MARSIDILDGDFYVNDPYSNYAWMREHDPVYWDQTNELWCISRYDDIVEIEKRKDLWLNSGKSKGGYRPNLPADDSIIGLDDPLHNKRRNLVSRRFTPKAVSVWQDDVRGEVCRLDRCRRFERGRRHRGRVGRAIAGNDDRQTAGISRRHVAEAA